jgi:IS30 family transposase
MCPRRDRNGCDKFQTAGCSPLNSGTLSANPGGMLQAMNFMVIDISSYSQAKLNALARQLNERPRKTLGFHTPADMFSQIVASTG